MNKYVFANLINKNISATIPVQSPASYPGFASNMTTNTPESFGDSRYFHASVAEHKADLDDQAGNPLLPREEKGEQALPRQGVIFESSHVRLLLEAIGDQNHPLRQQAERAVGGFAGAAEQAGVSTEALATREIKVPPEYQVVANLNQAAALTGVPPEEIVTIPDIRRELNLKAGRIQGWMRHGKHGQPNLTPLEVRLEGYRGSQQLLFRRRDVEELVKNPPKAGRPWQ